MSETEVKYDKYAIAGGIDVEALKPDEEHDKYAIAREVDVEALQTGVKITSTPSLEKRALPQFKQ